MIQIRYGVFETNSSSTHSFFIVTDEEYKKLKKVELLINRSWGWKTPNDTLTPKQAEEILYKEYPNWVEDFKGDMLGAMHEYGIASTLSDYMDDEYLETYEYPFTTPSGDKMVLFGKYGTQY